MTSLPEDITSKIAQLFHSAADRQQVQELLLTLWTIPLNVAADQLARGILKPQGLMSSLHSEIPISREIPDHRSLFVILCALMSTPMLSESLSRFIGRGVKDLAMAGGGIYFSK